jgi:hypothetical protein
MGAFFTGLSKRQSMLLLTAVTFGGQEAIEALGYLPEQEAELLIERANELLSIPRERLTPFLVQQMRKLVASQSNDSLLDMEPDLVVRAIAGERPAMIEVILQALPFDLARIVRGQLHLAPAESKREVSPKVLGVIRWKLEETLRAQAQHGPPFVFDDLLIIPDPDLRCLADALGARQAAAALVSLPPEAREEQLGRLSTRQRFLTQRALGAPAPALEAGPEAEALLESKSLQRAVRSLGVRRIATTCLSRSAELAARMIERHRDDFGRLLAAYVAEERKARQRRPPKLQEELLAELESLAALGLIDRPVRRRSRRARRP